VAKEDFIVVVVLVLLCHHQTSVLPAQSYQVTQRQPPDTLRISLG